MRAPVSCKHHETLASVVSRILRHNLPDSLLLPLVFHIPLLFCLFLLFFVALKYTHIKFSIVTIFNCTIQGY